METSIWIFFMFIKLLISQDAGKLRTLDEQLFFHSENPVKDR